MIYPGIPRKRISRSTVPEVGGVGSPVGEAGGAVLAPVGPISGVCLDVPSQPALGADGLVTAGTCLGFLLLLLPPAEGMAILVSQAGDIHTQSGRGMCLVALEQLCRPGFWGWKSCDLLLQASCLASNELIAWQ